MENRARIEDLLRLMQVPNFGAVAIQKVLNHWSLQELVLRNRRELYSAGWSDEQVERWFCPDPRLVDTALAWADQPDCHLISYLDSQYPYLLKQIHGAPPLLYVKGNLNAINSRQIAIVGSRHCTNYGEYWAKHFATELALSGLTVTSGLALGIDAYCHQAVVDIGAVTVAVLGNGLNRVYPARHRALADRILQNDGALVSEFLPDQPPVAENFPRRNRIISGLSLGTLVIEATEKSGSLITTRYALEQGRDIFALPGNIQNEFARGCHKLIKEGAVLVESCKDILDVLVSPQLDWTPLAQKFDSTFKEVDTLMTKLVEPNYPDLYAKVSYTPQTLDQLSLQSGLNVNDLLVQLLDLELQGLVENQNGWYKRV